MNTITPPHPVRDIVAVGAYLGNMGLLPATSGNLSARLDAQTIAITRSGTEKSELTEADMIPVRLDQPTPPGTSAETDLHLSLYRRLPQVGAVLHVHSPASTVLSRRFEKDGRVVFSGYELQKALPGIKSHETDVVIPVFSNSQDIAALSGVVDAGLNALPQAPGYLLAGHGLYTWGKDVAEARRHVVALEFLMACELEKLRIGGF